MEGRGRCWGDYNKYFLFVSISQIWLGEEEVNSEQYPPSSNFAPLKHWGDLGREFDYKILTN
jgi:hypothetical protein